MTRKHKLIALWIVLIAAVVMVPLILALIGRYYGDAKRLEAVYAGYILRDACCYPIVEYGGKEYRSIYKQDVRDNSYIGRKVIIKLLEGDEGMSERFIVMWDEKAGP